MDDFTNRWPPLQDGAASFKRMLGRAPADLCALAISDDVFPISVENMDFPYGTRPVARTLVIHEVEAADPYNQHRSGHPVRRFNTNRFGVQLRRSTTNRFVAHHLNRVGRNGFRANASRKLCEIDIDRIGASAPQPARRLKTGVSEEWLIESGRRAPSGVRGARDRLDPYCHDTRKRESCEWNHLPLPNEMRLSCGAELEGPQTEAYHR